MPPGLNFDALSLDQIFAACRAYAEEIGEEIIEADPDNPPIKATPWAMPASIPTRTAEERAMHDPTAGAVAFDCDITLPENSDQPVRAIPTIICAADWEGAPVPEREWLIEGMIPSRTVTLLSGDGGVGKSLLALQIGVAMALGVDMLGLEPMPGRCLYLGAEDDDDEFHRRVAAIARHHKRRLADARDFYLAPLAGLDAILSAPDRQGRMAPTQVWAELVEIAKDIEPSLIVLDTSADLFGGDEIKRAQVRQFVAMLRGLAMQLDCAVLLLSHPSLTGMQTGSGLSGSTAWNNSVRSRLYMEHVTEDKHETGVISLRTKKANYGPRDTEVRMRWESGVFVVDDGTPSPAQGLLNTKADEVFLSLLSKLTRQGQKLSPNNSPSYAPKIFAAHSEAAGFTKKQFAEAQQRLLDDELIKIVEEGPPSRRYKRLVVTSDAFN